MRNKTAEKYAKQIIRQNRELKLVKLGLMKVSALVQRELKSSRVDYLVSVFEPDKLGNPEVSHRDGYYYIMDGQHRVEAVKAWLGEGWQEQHMQCWVAEDLTEKEEAEVFLALNDKLNVDNFQKFKVAIRAGRPEETAIAAIITKEKLCISKVAVPGAVRAVGTLKKVYRRDGEEALERALRIARDAWGDAGLDALPIDGLGLVCHRYNGALHEQAAIKSLSNVHGGINGILGEAETLKLKTGNGKAHCFAAAVIRSVNRDRKGSDKLPDWWKT